MKTFFYGEVDTYIIPGFNGVVTLGGSRNFDSENMKICPYESAAIRERCENVVPALKKAELLREEVGLRPHRTQNVRVEAEWITNEDSKAIVRFRQIYFDEFVKIPLLTKYFALQLVHNYGHGGYGVCTAPGTTKYAIHLAMEMHKSSVAKL